MKKILFIVTQSEFGGAQRYIYEISQSLNLGKYEILVAAGQGDRELFKKLENTETRTLYLKQMKRTPLPWQIFLAIREIFSLLKKEKPDVLFLCSTTAGLLGSIAALFYRLFTVHCSLSIVYRIGGWAFRDPRPLWKNWLIFWAEKLTAPLKDKIIVNSEIDKNLALKYKIAREEKLIKISNGINIENLVFLSKEQARSRLNLNQYSNYKLIGTVANFYQTKGLEYLVEAACLIGAEPQAKFIIIGEGRLRPKLESLIKNYQLKDKVFLLGRLPEAYQYLKAFDIFVLPSLKEGFPWIILEVMAAEIPIVATDVGALPEIIDDGVNGFLVKPKNSQALAEKINWLLAHQNGAKEIGVEAKKKLEKEFTSQKMIEETAKTLSRL